MISVFCVAVAIRRKAFSYNTVCFSAFVMLLYNPFDFFSIGFQLSFVAVLSICFFLPPILKIIRTKNKIANFFWETSAVSLAVQLGTYPICLYYFGTFPTYFIFTNLVIVPLSTCVMYSSLGIYLAAFVSLLFPAHSGSIFFVPVWILEKFLALLLGFASFFESLPSALIKNMSLNLFQMFLLLLLSVFFLLYFQNKRPKTLMLIFGTISLFLLTGLPVFTKGKDSGVYLFNRKDKLEIGRVGETYFVSDTNRCKPFTFLEVSGLKVAVVCSDLWQGKKAQKPFFVDYLILSGQDSMSMYHLHKLFRPELVLLDGMLSARASRRLQRECKKLSISFYDVRENGAFRIKNY
jgi:competence protein ComEC